jgi:hypothetical protein
MWLPGHEAWASSQESWRLPQNFIEEMEMETICARQPAFLWQLGAPGMGWALAYRPHDDRREGWAQDGVAKGMSGGRVVILKGYNHDGKLIDGSVGKSLVYGATGGTVIVQGNADSGPAFDYRVRM